MPPTGAETKVKDAEYKNWLRVGLALYYLKDGLHSFIQGEVDALHQSLLQNLYGGSVVPKSQCSSCKSKDMKQNRNTYIWKFRSPCPSSLCDVWLTELMTFHTNPTSNKIYWENCDVTAWPFVPWECAKLYMPRGQPPANTGPSMSDSQALLTLMANCKYFHGKLSLTGLTLTHKVSTIRNRVMHSGDMRLSDSDRKSFIQDIIHLLEDPSHLISLEECKQAVDEINRIDNDSIDVFFNVDLQMIALKRAVSEVRQELGMQEERTLDTVEALKEEYRQLKEQLTTMLEAVETRMDTVENRQDTVENRVDTVENRMDTVENRQDTVENSVEAVEDRVDTVENRVDTVENRVDTVENRQDTVETRMDTVENSVEAVENRVDTVENRVDTVENRVDTVENRQDTVETRMDTVENRVDTIERDVQLVKEQTDSALHKKQKLSESVETISASIATHGIRLDAVDENVKSLRTKLQKFETVTEQTDTTQQQQMKLSESVETMSASVAIHGVRVEEVAENLVKLQEIGQRTGENNSCMKDIGKLRDDLIKAYSNLRCIQVSPIFERRRCDIDSIYVDLVIEEKQDKRNTQGESKQSKVAQSQSKEPIEVTSYKQIFLDEKGSKYKRVYLRGKGGLGKTTFCRKVLHAWCNAHEARAVAQDGFFQDEVVLKMFDLLFYMNLREVSSEENLIEVICAQFPLQDVPNKNILSALLEDNGDKVLFILDGLDEMIVKARFIENVVTRRVYPNCCFLVSSRPWKISQMELHEGTEIDLLLDLKGFSRINALKFAENIFRNCYEDGTVIKQFEKDVADNKLARQLIHVPLLLLFLAQVWYENERVLPSKLHELYILFFNLLVDRMNEKYKNDPNHRQMRFTLGDTQSPLPSKISETSLVANFGDGFLISLCEVAHHFLVSSQKHNSLVFEETKLQKALGDRGKEKLDLALDLGVLSVTDSVSYLNRKTNVSFLHKTMQEFFTALCFILSPDKLANFISSIADLNAVQQNENIIVFLVGLMPELGNKVLEKVNELCKDEWETLENGTRSVMFRFELDNISRIFLRCKEEVIGEDVLLNVSGLYLDYTQFDPHSWNPDFLQYLELFGFSYRHIFIDDVLVDLRGLTELTYLRLNEFPCDLYLPESGSLSALIINGTALSISCCDILGRMLTHCTKLKYLQIIGTDLHNCLLHLSNMTELAVLHVSGVTLSSSCCDVLGSTLTHCTKLKILSIKFTNLHNCLLDLSSMTELAVLDMSEVTLSSRCCDVLGSTLTHCTKLQTLSITRINLYNCLLDLSSMTKLTVLYMLRAVLSSSCCDVLGSTLTHCTELERLGICFTNLHNCQLDLSDMTELLVLHISNVALSSCCDVFGNTLTHCTNLEKIKICNTDLHNCLLDLSYMIELTVLNMSKVTLSSSCCDVLGSTLIHCIKLETLKISNTDLHNCLLDLSKMTELKSLEMSEVTMSSSCCDVLGGALTHCTKLKTLEIFNTNLHNCLLDLSNMTELTRLYIWKVTVSSSCCDVLGSTVTHCTKLETLGICSTELHNCLLDLSDMTELTHLNVSKVTLSSSCCDVSGSSTLTHCKKLHSFSIHKTDFHNCLLDLSNMTELKSLEMIEVTMSSSCCDVFGSSLTNCTKLETLKIHKTNLHNCLLDLSNMTELTSLDMSEVTLSSRCCDVFGSTFKHCTKCYTLRINYTNLHNCMFHISNMKALNQLELKGVILSSSACKHLELLYYTLICVMFRILGDRFEKSPYDNDNWKVNLLDSDYDFDDFDDLDMDYESEVESVTDLY